MIELDLTKSTSGEKYSLLSSNLRTLDQYEKTE